MTEEELETKIETEWSQKIEDYIQSLDWSEETPDYTKTLVAGNIRAYAAHLRNHIEENYIFINNFNRMNVLKLVSNKDGSLKVKMEDNKMTERDALSG